MFVFGSHYAIYSWRHREMSSHHFANINKSTSLTPRSLPLKQTSYSSLRVLIVTPRYFPFIGGVENHTYQVARRMAHLGIDITVLSADPSRQLPRSEQLHGVEIRRVPTLPGSRDSYSAPDIYRVITQEQWDIVHCQSYHTFIAPLAMLAALRSKIPYVVTFHGGGHSSRLRNAIRPIQLRILRPLLARANRLIATAQFEVEYFGKLLSLSTQQFIYIPNGGDIAQVPIPTIDSTDKTLITSVGRLERYKGHHRMIEALPKVLAQRPDVRLWVAGSGPYEKELRRMAHKLGIADRVEIRAIPPTERHRMAVELSKSALVTLLSEYETHPMAALEAIALGRSVLVADTSGLSELAQRGLARAIPLNSTSDQIAIAVLEQLNRPLVPPSVDLPTWDECAADLVRLYHTIIRTPTHSNVNSRS